MTAPSAVSEISAQIAAIQALVASVSAPAAADSGAQFSAALASATGDDSTTTSATAVGSTGGSSVAGAAGVGGVGGVGGVAVGSAADNPTAAAVVKDAESYLGTPYVFGAESHAGIDCSGLVQAAYKSVGISLPRVAADQAKVGTEVPSLAQAQPGDVLTFGNPAYHAAIYLGNNKLIESPEPGKTVHITDVYQTPTSIRRIVPASTAVATAAVAPTVGGLSGSQLTAAGLSAKVAGYAPQFAAAEARYGLPSGLLAAVAQQESSGNAAAVSTSGAEGLMQLMPSTASGMGVNAFDPGQAINAAAKILSGSLTRYDGSVPLALAAYNAGAGAVAKYDGVPPYSQTQNYVRDITAMMAAGG